MSNRKVQLAIMAQDNNSPDSLARKRSTGGQFRALHPRSSSALERHRQSDLLVHNDNDPIYHRVSYLSERRVYVNDRGHIVYRRLIHVERSSSIEEQRPKPERKVWYRHVKKGSLRQPGEPRTSPDEDIGYRQSAFNEEKLLQGRKARQNKMIASRNLGANAYTKLKRSGKKVHFADETLTRAIKKLSL